MPDNTDEMLFCREIRAAMESELNFTGIAVYQYGMKLAEFNGDMELYDESDRLNSLCAGDVDEALRACEYGGGTYEFKPALDALIEQYGLERVSFVLACEVNYDSIFGRYPDELYKWAREMSNSEHYGSYGIRTRPNVLVGLIAELQARTGELSKQHRYAEELTKAEMIKLIMADIVRRDPEYPTRGLEEIEKNMRRKSIEDVRNDYYFYFPNEKTKMLNNEPGLETETQHKRLYVDMDGTLAVFNIVDDMTPLYQEGYFAGLHPQENAIDAIKIIMRERSDIEVYSLSAYLHDSPHALAEKNGWLDAFLPEIEADNRVFVPCGSDKAAYIESGVKQNDFLLDDFTQNLNAWEQGGGTGLKLLNDINNTRGTWQGNKTRFDNTPREIADKLKVVIDGIGTVKDKNPKRRDNFHLYEQNGYSKKNLGGREMAKQSNKKKN